MTRIPRGFRLLCQGLHQDAVVGRPTVDELARDCLAFVPLPDAELARFLAVALERLESAELKGLINRQKTSISMDSKTARAFFVAVDEELRARGHAS